MRRWLLNIFAALSLLLMLGVATLWVRSYLGPERVVWNDGGGGSLLASKLGYLTYYTFNMGWSGSELGYRRFNNGDPADPIWYATPSWRYERFRGGCIVSFPHWALFLPLMIAPLLWLRRWRRERWTRGRGFAMIVDSQIMDDQ